MYDTSHQPESMQARYKFLPPEITELFEFGTVELIMDQAALEFGLNDSQKEGLLMEVELVLYFFLTRKGLVERLRETLEVDQARATQIAAKLENDLFIIVDDLLDAIEKEFESEDTEVAPVPEETSTSAPPAETLPTTPAPTTYPPETPPNPATLAAVKPMRTYSDDVNMSRAHSYGAFKPEGDDGDPDEPVHRSNQDDIIGK